MWNLKIRYKAAYLQNRNRPTNVENKLTITKGERVEGEVRSLGLKDTHHYI